MRITTERIEKLARGVVVGRDHIADVYADLLEARAILSGIGEDMGIGPTANAGEVALACRFMRTERDAHRFLSDMRDEQGSRAMAERDDARAEVERTRRAIGHEAATWNELADVLWAALGIIEGEVDPLKHARDLAAEAARLRAKVDMATSFRVPDGGSVYEGADGKWRAVIAPFSDLTKLPKYATADAAFSALAKATVSK